MTKNLKVPEDIHTRLAVAAAKAKQRIGEYTAQVLDKILPKK